MVDPWAPEPDRGTPQAPPDWYADPERPGLLRYWDGFAWTQARQPIVPAAAQSGLVMGYDPTLKSRSAAGILGILLGSIGVHRFYLGFVGIGLLQILVTVLTCGLGGLWGFIEGILLLTGSMNSDARGRPLAP